MELLLRKSEILIGVQYELQPEPIQFCYTEDQLKGMKDFIESKSVIFQRVMHLQWKMIWRIKSIKIK